MSSVIISGDTSGSVSLVAPAIAGSTTLTLPATSGNVLTSSTNVTFSDGTVQTSAASPYVLKNRLINGGFNVSQYNGTSSVTPTTNGYYIDRWYIDTFGSSSFNSLTMQQLSASPPTGYSNYLQIASGSTTSTNINLSQSIEYQNCYDLAGQTVTLSFWYKVPVNWTNQWQAFISSNTSANTKISGGSSGTTSSTALTLTNTTTWTKATLTYTIPSNAQTVGVLFNNGNNNIINGAQFQITGVQLEIGSSATPFERRLYNQELANCQRYYWRWTCTNQTNIYFSTAGRVYSNTGATITYPHPVPMRTAPTTNNSNNFSAGIWDYSVTAITTNNSGYAGSPYLSANLNVTGTFATPPSNVGYSMALGSGSAGGSNTIWIDFSSEL